jgi:hypothetical protein
MLADHDRRGDGELAVQWLQLRNVTPGSLPEVLFPDPTTRCARDSGARPSSSTASCAKTERADLPPADCTFLNERLARHYGIRT